jgi:hypothetical protein
MTFVSIIAPFFPPFVLAFFFLLPRSGCPATDVVMEPTAATTSPCPCFRLHAEMTYRSRISVPGLVFIVAQFVEIMKHLTRINLNGIVIGNPSQFQFPSCGTLASCSCSCSFGSLFPTPGPDAPARSYRPPQQCQMSLRLCPISGSIRRISSSTHAKWACLRLFRPPAHGNWSCSTFQIRPIVCAALQQRLSPVHVASHIAIVKVPIQSFQA